MTGYLASAGVQKFSITLTPGNNTGTATISAVGSGAFILYGGASSSTGGIAAEAFAYLTLTNSTTITATRNASSTQTTIITGCIVDGDTTNLIKSVQYGTVTIAASASSGTATISAVTANNTAVHYLGASVADTAKSLDNDMAVLTLSGTTVTATNANATGNAGEIVGFVIIEFQGAALNQAVQRVAASSSSSVTSYTASITSVNLNNTLSIYGGQSDAAITTGAVFGQSGELTNGTTFTVNVNTAAASAKKFNASIVEFVSGVLAISAQRGTTTLTGVSSNTTTISTSVLNQSALSWLGNTSTNSTNIAYSKDDGKAVLTNTTTVTVSRNDTANNITGSWEVVEFATSLPPPASSSDALWFGMTF